VAHNDQRNNDAPPPWNLSKHLPENTAHRLTHASRKADAAGFGAFGFGFLDIPRILIFPPSPHRFGQCTNAPLLLKVVRRMQRSLPHERN
jgi:hypothetical protein